MKKWIVAIALLGGVGLASGEILQRWTYDEVAGKALHECSNSGTVGTPWDWETTAKFVTDGNGSLEIVEGSGGYKTSGAFPAPLSGPVTYSLEIKIAEWDIQTTNGIQSKLNFRMPTSSQIDIQTVLDPVNGLGVTFICAGSNYRTYWEGGMTGSNAVARIDFNIDQGSATYYLNDVEKESFTGLTFGTMDKFLMQKVNFDTTSGNTLKIGEQTLSNADEPEGVYVFDKYVSGDSNAGLTNTVKTFNVQTGDVIVVVSASSSKDEPALDSISFTSGTATVDPVVSARADEFKGCSARYWYTTATSSGTVPVEVQRDGTAYWIVGAYQLRSGDGYTVPALMGTPQTVTLDSASSFSKSYTVGTNYSGVCIESLSSYGSDWVPVTSNVLLNGVGYDGQRNIASGTFSGVATFDSVWASTNAANQLTSVGLAFASRPDGIVATPQELYNTWIGGYSVGGDIGMTDDADSDLLDNLTEYAFGGEPDNAAHQGNVPVQSIVNDGGTDYIEYIYHERDDAVALGLASIFEFGTDLININWADATGYETGRGASGEDGFDVITNRIPTDVEAKQFIQLQIEFTP